MYVQYAYAVLHEAEHPRQAVANVRKKEGKYPRYIYMYEGRNLGGWRCKYMSAHKRPKVLKVGERLPGAS